MIRGITKEDYEDVNKLLRTFNYELDDKSFENDFLKTIVYVEDSIKAVLVYQLIYDRIEIDYIITDPKYRKRGIATSLLNYAFKDTNKASLEVKSDNVSAIAFYEKNGFKKVAIRKKYYKDQDGILMVRE